MSQENIPISSTISEDGSCSLCGREPICGGLGMLRYNVEIDHPNFGKMYRCPNHDTIDDERLNTLRKISNLDAFIDKRFENFFIDAAMLTEQEQQSLTMAFELGTQFSQHPQGWLLLEGAYGSGKTHLAAATGNVLVENGDPVVFITAPDLLDHLRSTYSTGAETTYDETFDRLRNVRVLILDDLGVENPSPWAQEKLFQLLNHRYSYKLPTIITTNMDIDRLDARLRSRLLDEEFTKRVKITAPDYRSSVANESQQILSNLGLYRDMNFETFQIERNLMPKEQENLHRAVDLARAFAETPRGWLVWMGSFGSGKTHLAAAIANDLEMRGTKVTFVTVPDLLDYLRVTFDPSANTSFDQRFQAVRKSELLVLDDLGTENATSWAKEKLFQILDYRYVAQLPTVITTGKPLEELDTRVRSRLMDDRRCHLFAITAESYALRRRRR